MKKVKMSVTDGLKEGTDYKRISYVVMDEDFNMTPFGRYCGIDMNEILDISEENLKKIARNSKGVDPRVSPLPDGEGVGSKLFQPEGRIDIDTAVDCGFGVIELENGERFMYDALFNEDDLRSEFDHDCYQDDLRLRFAMYMTVTEPNYYSKNLAQIFQTEPQRLAMLFLPTGIAFLEKLESIVDEKAQKGI